MKNEAAWKPSKFAFRKGKLRAMRNSAEVGVGSRLICDLVARFYGATIPQYCRGHVLDMGCGKVPLYEAYRPFVDRVTCIDWSASPHDTCHVDQQCDLSQPIPFDVARFDTVILSDVLEHLPNPTLAISEAARVLAPGGHLLINTPFFYGIHEQPHDYYRYTGYALKKLVESAGLTLVRLEPIGGAPEAVIDLFAKFLARIPLVGRASAIAFQACWRGLLRIPAVSRFSRATAEKFPLGYALVATKTRVPSDNAYEAGLFGLRFDPSLREWTKTSKSLSRWSDSQPPGLQPPGLQPAFR
jgi:SAM-dependent methyltransferase